MAYRLSPDSKQDIEQIGRYIEGVAGPRGRRTVLATIRRGLVLLGRYPWLGRARDDDLGMGRRSLPAGKYIIIYKAEGKVVTVLRIIDGRRNYPPLFRS